jgi:hypothetical protein
MNWTEKAQHTLPARAAAAYDTGPEARAGGASHCISLPPPPPRPEITFV